MLTDQTISLVSFVIGVPFGVYLPVAFLYLVSIVRDTRGVFVRIMQVIGGSLIILYAYAAIFVIINFGILGVLGATTPSGEHLGPSSFGGGTAVGFLLGILLFIVGLVSGYTKPRPVKQ